MAKLNRGIAGRTAAKKTAAPAAKKKTTTPAKKVPGGLMGGMQTRIGGTTAVQRRQQQNKPKPNASGQMTSDAPKIGAGDIPDRILSDEEWLGSDPEYQDELIDFNNLDTQSIADWLRRKNVATETKTQTLNTLGVEQPKTTEALNEQYAARGIESSGIFSNALKDLGSSYAAKRAAAESAEKTEYGNVDTEKAAYDLQKPLSMQKLKRTAIRRRMPTLG